MCAKIRKEMTMDKWLWPLLGIGLFGVMAIVLLPALEKPHDDSGLYCASQLNGIGKACYMYMGDYEGKMPPNLEILVETEDMRKRDFVCPLHVDESESSYIYRGADLTEMDDSVGSKLVVAYEQEENHTDRDDVGYRNVLFMDSHVKHFSEAEFQKIIAKDNKIRRETGLQEKPVEGQKEKSVNAYN